MSQSEYHQTGTPSLARRENEQTKKKKKKMYKKSNITHTKDEHYTNLQHQRQRKVESRNVQHECGWLARLKNAFAFFFRPFSTDAQFQRCRHIHSPWAVVLVLSCCCCFLRAAAVSAWNMFVSATHRRRATATERVTFTTALWCTCANVPRATGTPTIIRRN